MFARFSRKSFVLFLVMLINGISCDEECDFKCEENGKCILGSSLCNGIEDCLHGSDESYVTCKYLNDMPKPNTFVCANGAEIDAPKKCNMAIDCVDKSDESVMICEELFENINKTIKGNGCRRADEMRCTSKQCISTKKRCDGTLDCFNGRDESVELCMEQCDFPNFQCANGKCIAGDLICNNVFDCVDGSDELSNICEYRTEWRNITPVKCREPTDIGLRFSNETKFYSNKEFRFVYANGPVHFECFDRSGVFTGNEWNVCMVTGKWRHDLPECQTKWRNLDPNTNGTNGCPINTYSQYKDRLRIYQCANDGTNCSIQVQPPINDMVVKFACDYGYTLYPEETTNNNFGCKNKKFVPELLWKGDPRCVKKCSSAFLYCRDSMSPVCRSNVGKTFGCKSSTDLAPGTIATFSCKSGFRGNESGLTLTCQEDGTWRNTTNMDNFCKLECGQPIQDSLSRGAPMIEPPLSPWSVAIFLFNDTTSVFEHICGGVLIRHNLVLTAAHCVSVNRTKTIYDSNMFRVGPSSSKNSTVNGNFGWSVKKIKISPHYHPITFQGDTAIIHIEENDNIIFNVICLPWLNDNNMAKIKNGDNGQVCTWDTGAILNTGRLNLTMVSVRVSYLSEQDFRIRTYLNEKICKGDSGSGFIMDGFCEKDNKTQQFIYGIVSSTGFGSDQRDGCTNYVTITNVEHSGNRDFIQEILDETLNTCDQI